MQHQPKLHYDDLDDALYDLVMLIGGYKKVGPRLWPNLPADDAAQRLRACLNKSRREKLDPHETLLLLTWSREAEFHGVMHFIADSAGYQRAAPVDPKEEKSKAAEAVQAAAEALQRATAALERASAAEQRLRSVS